MAAHMQNSPSFQLQRSRSEKVAILELLSNIAPGQRPSRNIVLAASLSPQTAAALSWILQHLAKPGDAVHLCHVVRCLHTTVEVYHSGPGNAYSAPDVEPHHERQDVVQAQTIIKERLLPQLTQAGLLYNVHVYVDTENTPADAIGSTVLQLASDVDACAVVLAANDAVDSDPQRLGSVAKWVAGQRQPHPVVLVREQLLILPSAPAAAPPAEAPIQAATDMI